MPSILEASAAEQHPLVASQLPSWYSQHEQHALKSVVIPLPYGFLDYLQEDGVFLPDDSAAVPALDHIDAGLLVAGEYRRDDWDSQQQQRPDQAVAPAPHPSPSGPLHSGSGGAGALLSGAASHSSPGPATSGPADPRQVPAAGARVRRDSGSSASSSEAGGPGPGADWSHRFPSLRAAIDAAIRSLGGRVVPKLNWSAPSDAVWVTADGSLCCRHSEQVVLLLKSSDRLAAHDVALLARAAEGQAGQRQAAEGAAERADERAEEGCTESTAAAAEGGGSEEEACSSTSGAGAGSAAAGGGAGAGPGPGSCASQRAGSPGGPLAPVLVLKKWYNLRPEGEFRCFVRCGRLVACSQRDVSQSFPSLQGGGAARGALRSRLWAFWTEHMRGAVGMHQYAYDVYVPSEPSLPLRLLDVNPIADTTAPLLFDWVELGLGGGPAGGAPPPAEELLRGLLPRRAATSAAAAPSGQQGAEEAGELAEGAEGAGCPAALPLPTCAQELQVRVVEGGAGGGGRGAEGGLAGLVGPMLLGSRAALAMPYDMLGLADSVEQMIEVMMRGEQRGRQGRQGWAGQECKHSDSSETDEDGDGEGSEEEGHVNWQETGSRREPGVSAGVPSAMQPDQEEVARLFGRGLGAGAAVGEGEEGELAAMLGGGGLLTGLE